MWEVTDEHESWPQAQRPPFLGHLSDSGAQHPSPSL